MGSCYRAQEQNQKALETAQQALDVATAAGDKRGQAAALTGLGWASSNLDKNQEALEFLNRALPLAQQVGDSTLEAGVLRRIGAVTSNLKQPQKALEFYDRSLEISHRIGDGEGEGLTLHQPRSLVFRAWPEAKGIGPLQPGVALARLAGDRATEARLLGNIGSTDLDLGEKQKALDFFGQVLVYGEK